VGGVGQPRGGRKGKSLLLTEKGPGGRKERTYVDSYIHVPSDSRGQWVGTQGNGKKGNVVSQQGRRGGAKIIHRQNKPKKKTFKASPQDQKKPSWGLSEKGKGKP